VLVQIHLPTWDGYEVIRRLKEDPRSFSVPVILLASCATTAEKARGIDMGAVDFISKPFDPIELLARVHSALRTKAYLDLLEQRAHIDGLTELSNRHALQNRLQLEWENCLRRGNPLAIQIIDLDHFKRINDQYGHAAGDEVLRQTAATLRTSFRETDFIARYGGEEFVVLAPNCELTAAIDRAEILRKNLASLEIEFRTSTITVTSSIGIALAFDSAQGKPLEALDQADQALYGAKGAGRNCVWIWDSHSQAPIALETWRHGAAGRDGRPQGEDPSRDEKPKPSLAETTPSCC
jgi:diguanylate cyclase (GGDEF)-like protein